MKKALIVGCDGQDGRLLYDLLIEKGYALVGIDKTSVRCTSDQVKMARVDITDNNQVGDLIRVFEPDEVYYLAAFHHSAEDVPIDEIELFRNSYQVNVNSMLHFLEAIRKHSPSARFFYAASSHIFGNADENVQDENTPIRPNGVYGITKAAGLHICRYYRNKHSIFASVGILYNHESRFRGPQFVSKKIIRGALNIKNRGQEYLVLGDLSAKVDWGYAPDYVDAMHRMLNTTDPDDYIVATGVEHSVRDFVEIAFSALSLDWKRYVKEEAGLLSKSKKILIGNPQKLMNKTGWKPSVDFTSMIHILLDEERSYNERA